MAISNSFKYATSAWLTSVVASPVLMISYDYLTSGPSNLPSASGGSYAAFLFLAFIFGLILSLPVWLLLILFVKMINKSGYGNFSKKLFTLAFAVFITGILFYILFASIYVTNIKEIMLSFPVFYVTTLSLGVLLYKFPPDFPKEQAL